MKISVIPIRKLLIYKRFPLDGYKEGFFNGKVTVSFNNFNTKLPYDLTKRERAEEALHESEQYNSMLFEESTIGLTLCRGIV